MYLAIIELTQTHQCNKSLTKSKTTEINLWFYVPIDWYNQKMNFIEVRGHACTFGKHGILECAISHGAQESTIYGSGHARSKKINNFFTHWKRGILVY
jgi:hypothetical protein